MLPEVGAGPFGGDLGGAFNEELVGLAFKGVGVGEEDGCFEVMLGYGEDCC